MAKNTETWVLRYMIPTIQHKKEVSSRYFDSKLGTNRFLYKDCTIKSIEPLEPNALFPLFLFDEYFGKGKEIDGCEKNKRYLQRSFEVNNNEKEETLEQKRDKACVKFIKSHYEVSNVSLSGDEQNPNISSNSTVRYQLINLDAIENEIADKEELVNELIGELTAIKKNSEEEFNNLSYGLGINPTHMSLQANYNFIVNQIKKDPLKFKKFLHEDTDKYFKMVANKALKVDKTANEPYIKDDGSGNYYMGGSLIASSYNSLIGYLKDNTEVMEFLEADLGFKKKEPIKASTKPPKKTEE